MMERELTTPWLQLKRPVAHEGKERKTIELSEGRVGRAGEEGAKSLFPYMAQGNCPGGRGPKTIRELTKGRSRA